MHETLELMTHESLSLFYLVALDWGGPRREWFELICKALFDTTNQLFTRFSDNNQALVSLQISYAECTELCALTCCWLNNAAAKLIKWCATLPILCLPAQSLQCLSQSFA